MCVAHKQRVYGKSEKKKGTQPSNIDKPTLHVHALAEIRTQISCLTLGNSQDE